MRGASSNPYHLFLSAKLLKCLYQALTKQTLISAHAWNLEGVHFISYMWNKSEFYSKLSLNSLINISIINFNNCFPILTPVEHFWYLWYHWSLSPWHGHLVFALIASVHVMYPPHSIPYIPPTHFYWSSSYFPLPSFLKSSYNFQFKLILWVRPSTIFQSTCVNAKKTDFLGRQFYRCLDCEYKPLLFKFERFLPSLDWVRCVNCVQKSFEWLPILHF